MDISLMWFAGMFNRNKDTKQIGEYLPGDKVKVKYAEIGINLDGYEFTAEIKEYMGSDLYSGIDLSTNMICLIETHEIIKKL